MNRRSAPSFVTRFTRWVHNLPIRAGTFYLLLFLAGLILSFITRWVAGVLPASPIAINDVYDMISDPILIVGILAIYYYVDDEIAEAMDRARSLSTLSVEEYARVSYELVVIPLWPHLIVALLLGAGAIQGAMEAYGFDAIQASNVLLLMEWGLTGGLFFGFAYRVIRLIVLSGKFYAGPLQLNLFNLPPLYELSTAVGKVALFQLFLWYPNLVFNLGTLDIPYKLVIVLIVSLGPLMAFLVPQAVLSRRLTREKSNRIVAVQKELESTFARLSSVIKSQSFDGVKAIQSTIESLLSEKRFIESVPTWPWRLGTFRIAITAIVLPVIVWLIQQVLDRFLSF